jgi:hypothetical protein
VHAHEHAVTRQPDVALEGVCAFVEGQLVRREGVLEGPGTLRQARFGT